MKHGLKYLTLSIWQWFVACFSLINYKLKVFAFIHNLALFCVIDYQFHGHVSCFNQKGILHWTFEIYKDFPIFVYMYKRPSSSYINKSVHNTSLQNQLEELSTFTSIATL